MAQKKHKRQRCSANSVPLAVMLRRKAEEVTGSKIEYLYEHEMLAAQIKHEKEGIEV